MYNIEALAGLTGLTRRTIRYYVQRGLLDPPRGGGRGSYYTEEHLEKLKKIQKWAEQGVPLIHINSMLAGEEEKPVIIEFESRIQTIACERFRISEGVELIFKSGMLSHKDLKQVQIFIQEMQRSKTNDDD